MAAGDELDGLDQAVRYIVGDAPGTARLDTLQRLLRDEYHLGELTPLAQAVDALDADALDLSLLRDRVTSAIRTRHPAIAIWLTESFPTGLPSGVDRSEVDVFLHRVVLLQVVMDLVATRPGFLEELHRAIAQQRERSGLRASGLSFARDVQQLTGGVFEGLKLLLLDVAIDGYLERRAAGETELSGVLLRKNISLDLNVLEAALNDAVKGYWANAGIGFRLLVGRVQRLEVKGPELFVRQWLPDGWTRRYHSWNLAFFVGNINNLDLLLPKLFVPAVVDASPEDYLYLRAVSVWFLANVVVHVLSDNPERAQPMPTDRSLAKRLGKLNRELWT